MICMIFMMMIVMMMIDVDDMSVEVVHCVVGKTDHIEDIEESAKRSPALQTT